MFAKFEKNIIDLIKEQQLKLGYRKEVVRLYYPAISISRLLGTKNDINDINVRLSEFVSYEEKKLGKIEFNCKNERYCIKMPEEAGEYVHKNMEEDEFIQEFIKTVGKHGCAIQDVITIFKKYSSNVHIEKMENQDFDYVIYFEDSSIDEYIYCITIEGEHLIYHRFLPEDYKEIVG